MKIKQNRILWIHILFWCIYFSFFFYQISNGKANRDSSNYQRPLIDAAIQVITLSGISYFNYFILLPLFYRKKVMVYVFSLIASLACIIGLQLYLKSQIYADVMHGEQLIFIKTWFIIQHTLNVIFVMLFVSMLRFASDWFDIESKRQEIENEKLTTELRYLKDQINPHFLFNTLNNIYYLAHKQSPKTKDVVSKLSEMMRYMLHDAQLDFVPISKEITYIKNYIELEKLRIEEDFIIDFTVEGNYEGLNISPFTFITFLENAFKHGINTELGNEGIKITLSFNESNCTYQVKNTISRSNSEKVESGIGLTNFKRKINLVYPNRHKIEIYEKDEIFIAKLELNLTGYKS